MQSMLILVVKYSLTGLISISPVPTPDILKLNLFHWKTRLWNTQIHGLEVKRIGMSNEREERVRTFKSVRQMCSNPSSPSDQLYGFWFPSDSFSPIAQLCPVWLCDPKDCSSPGFLSITNSRSLLKLMSIKLVVPSNHLILCHPLLLLPSVFPSTRVFSNEPVLCIRLPRYWIFIQWPKYQVLDTPYFPRSGKSEQECPLRRALARIKWYNTYNMKAQRHETACMFGKL